MAQEKKNNPDVGAAVDSTVAPATSTAIKDETKVEVEARVPAVYYTCPNTFETFAWLEVGDKQEMTYKQLRIMNAKFARYFSEKWIVPLNEAVIKKLGLEKYYKNQIKRDDYKLLFGSDVAAVKELLANLGTQAKEEMKDKVISYVKNGKIENVKVIRVLEKQLNVELMDFV